MIKNHNTTSFKKASVPLSIQRKLEVLENRPINCPEGGGNRLLNVKLPAHRAGLAGHLPVKPSKIFWDFGQN
jgi:hypothetical protein